MDLKESDDQLALLAERLPQLVWLTSASGSHDYFNQRWYELTGTTPEQCVGEGWKKLIHPEDIARVEALWQQALAAGSRYEAEYRLRKADGSYCWMLSRGQAHRSPEGQINRWYGTCTNIDAQKTAEAALTQLEERHRLALAAANLGTWTIDVATNTTNIDTATRNLMNLPSDFPDSIPLDEALSFVHQDDREAVREQIAAALDPRSDGSYDIEYRVSMAHGNIRWVRAKGKVFFTEEDGVRRADKLAGVISDCTEQRGMDEARLLLTRELNHRVKNLFAIANGMVSMTARTAKDTKDMAVALRGRLSALSRAHELVQPPSASDPGGGEVDFDRLIEAVLAPYKDTDSERITMEGPAVRVGSNTTTSLALVLHELATNAAKYGCLSGEGGHLSIRWTIKDEAVALEWVETEGPPIGNPPTFEGFGSQLAQRSIAGQLGGALEREWRHEGLCVYMTLPLNRLSS